MKSVAEVLSDQNRAAAEGDPGDQPRFPVGARQGYGTATGQSVAHLEDDVALRAGGPATREDSRQAGREGDRVSDRGGRMRSCVRRFRRPVTAVRRGRAGQAERPHANLGYAWRSDASTFWAPSRPARRALTGVAADIGIEDVVRSRRVCFRPKSPGNPRNVVPAVAVKGR